MSDLWGGVTSQILASPWSLWGLFVTFGLVVYLVLARVGAFGFLHTRSRAFLDIMMDLGDEREKRVGLPKVPNYIPLVLQPFYTGFVDLFGVRLWPAFLGFILVMWTVALMGFLSGTVSFLGLLMWAFLPVLVGFYITIQAEKKREQMIEQFPVFLQGLSRSLQAGYSFSGALDFMANELGAPLDKPLKVLQQELALQIPLEEALTSFARKLDHSEVYFFTESTIIQLRVGANLVELFARIGDLIEEKLKLEREIRTFTSQGKMSGWLIAGLWPASLALFWFIAPEHVEVLLQTTKGNVLLFIAILLEALGFFCIWRIVQIKI